MAYLGSCAALVTLASLIKQQIHVRESECIVCINVSDSFSEQQIGVFNLFLFSFLLCSYEFEILIVPQGIQ